MKSLKNNKFKKTPIKCNAKLKLLPIDIKKWKKVVKNDREKKLKIKVSLIDKYFWSFKMILDISKPYPWNDNNINWLIFNPIELIKLD